MEEPRSLASPLAGGFSYPSTTQEAKLYSMGNSIQQSVIICVFTTDSQQRLTLQQKLIFKKREAQLENHLSVLTHE